MEGAVRTCGAEMTLVGETLVFRRKVVLSFLIIFEADDPCEEGGRGDGRGGCRCGRLAVVKLIPRMMGIYDVWEEA